MQKIKDRMLLGVIAGLGANVVKFSLGKIFKNLGWAEIDSTERAAGMLIPAHTIATKKGKIVGFLADEGVASLLGIASVYALSVVGKENATLKGALTGQAAWTMLYGVFGTMGATKVNPVSSATVLTEFVIHTAYGATVTTIITKLGDSSLFDSTMPMSVSPQKVQQ